MPINNILVFEFYDCNIYKSVQNWKTAPRYFGFAALLSKEKIKKLTF